MINNELLKFVQEQLAHNVPKEQIIAILKPGGWSEADVAEALQALQSSAVPLLKTLPVSPGGTKRTLVISIIALFLVAAGVAVWFYSNKVKTPVVSTESQAVPASIAPVVAPSIPVLPFDSDLSVVWTKVYDEQNSASAIISAGQTISKDDAAFLSRYFGKGYEVKGLPVVASANTIASRNTNTLKAFDQSSTTPYFQCSAIMTPEQCNLSPVQTVGQLLLLRSYVLEKANKSQEALPVTLSEIELGKKVMEKADDAVLYAVSLSLSKGGYERLIELNKKLTTSVKLSPDEKTSRINMIRESEKSMLRFMYTRKAEGLEYIADKNKTPSYPQTPNDIIAAEDYRKSVTPESFSLNESKKYFYDSYKTSIENVDVACGGAMKPMPYNFGPELVNANASTTQSAIPNYVGKVLYWTTFASFDGLNTKRCEVESLINKI
ncbi:MAG: hypothetical protein EXS59_00575 [Candidatus Taylorbacteria bacterium]|nr:hypothetical protein [Candidatus Taylorbacteria bacterium]